MSCANINACNFNASFPSLTGPKRILKLTTLSSTFVGIKLPKNAKVGVSRQQQQCTTVCLFGGGKGKSSNDNEASPWKALEKAMGNLKKEKSVEDLLKQQIEKQEYFDGGDGGGDHPGGGGGGGDDASGGAEDEGIPGILDELGQVVLATMGFICLYIYIIESEEITVFAKDILKFIFLRQKSIRLGRTIARWESYFKSLSEKEVDPYWLESEILNTTTWYDGPTKYRRILRRLQSDSDY